MSTLTLHPIKLDEQSKNALLQINPALRDMLEMSIDFYRRVGFVAPWIGYLAMKGDVMVGSCGFKGPPKNNTVEIAYWTFAEFEKQGIGKAMCRELTALAVTQDSSVRVTARTLPEENASAKILRHNNYVLLGTVIDEDDGPVWEWEYQPAIDGR